MKSSHYGLNILGYTRAIMIKTIGGDYSSKSRSKKIILVRIKDWKSSLWSWNR